VTHLILWLVTAATAGSITDVLGAEDLLRSGRPGRASQEAASLIKEDEGNLGAHYVHVKARARGLRDGPAVEELYRAWMHEEPDVVAARFGLATALTMANIPEAVDGAWCEEVESLIGGALPRELHDAVWTVRLRIDARTYCPTDAAEDIEALTRLGRHHDYALALSIKERTRDGQVSNVVADDFSRLVADSPELASEAGAMMIKGFGGEGLSRASSTQLRTQRALVTHDEPRVVAFAATALTLAHDEGGAKLALNNLYKIDPGRSWTVPTSEGIARWFVRARPHTKKRDPSALSGRLIIALRSDSDERANDALQQLRAIWERDPRDTDAAYAFARAAAHRKTYQRLAVAAMDHAIDTAPAWDPRGLTRAESYDDWKREASADVGLWLCERGWNQRSQGYLNLAAGDLRLAILSHPDPPAEFHMRLGLIYYDLGAEEDALFQLGLGLSSPGEEPDRAEALQVGERLYFKQAWAPGGFEGWVSSHARD